MLLFQLLYGYKMSIGQISGTSPNSAAKSAADPGLRELNSAAPVHGVFTYGIDTTGIYDVERALLGRKDLFFPALREDAVR
jgi:hypothetical protein